MNRHKHITEFLNQVLEKYEQQLLEKYKVKTIYDINLEKLSKAEQDLFFDLVDKKVSDHEYDRYKRGVR